MKAEEQKLLDWQEKIEALRTKTTELKTRTDMLEKQLAEYGIKDPAKAQDIIDRLGEELKENGDQIESAIKEIEEEFDLDEEG